ncbi:hypothetical protein L3Y34_001082 [Caenorhabditis briggsae]|uniref:Homeobox-cysteine loop-homeobox domain-containing protein n=1 Tax=Caenorhabditis briggsae TaxID=6238 RepID=A0AAE9IPZ4_CAEBR|nr:hypothetical protein L3Y34_001082 [Caenorhabditis briggsae]
MEPTNTAPDNLVPLNKPSEAADDKQSRTDELSMTHTHNLRNRKSLRAATTRCNRWLDTEPRASGIRAGPASISPGKTLDMDSWCEQQTRKLEDKKQNALSRISDEDFGESDSQGTENSNEEDSASQDPSDYSEHYSFEDDKKYFEANRHPSITDMIRISGSATVSYQQVFYRFSELRLFYSEKCSANDTCRRVAHYFQSNIRYKGRLTMDSLEAMRQEFNKFCHHGPVLNIGSVHLLVDKLEISPGMVQKCYKKWLEESQHSGSEFDSIVFEEQQLFQQQMDKHCNPRSSAAIEHDNSKQVRIGLKRDSLLRIIRKRPQLSVSEAIVLKGIYKVDLKTIQKLVKQYQEPIQTPHEEDMNSEGFDEEVPNAIKLFSKKTRKRSVPTIPYVLRKTVHPVFDFSAEQLDRIETKPEEEGGVPDISPAASSSSTGQSSFFRAYRAGGKDNLIYGPGCSTNIFPGDYQYFMKNQHPTIQEMIDISKSTGTKYKQVFYRFLDFRCAFNVKCPPGDNCDKVLKFFAHRAAYDGILNGDTVNRMYDIFEMLGPAGKNPDTGYMHLVASEIDLPPFIIRDQYKEWLSEKKSGIESDRIEEIHQKLELEFNENPELTYERLQHLSNKYETTQKVVVNFFNAQDEDTKESLLQALTQLDSQEDNAGDSRESVLADPAEFLDHLNSMLCSNSEPTPENAIVPKEEISNVLDDQLYSTEECEKTDGGAIKNCFYETPNGSLHNLMDPSHLPPRAENVERARKIKFKMKRSSNSSSSDSKRIKLAPTKSKASNKNGDTEDEDIDVVGIEENSTPNSVAESAWSDDYQNVYHFQGDIDIFEANRHPSIQDMVNVSHDVGVSYEQVYFRFKHLRTLKNEVCEDGDDCQKVESFSQMNPVFSGTLDAKTLAYLHMEFDKLIDFGYYLPLGYIHLILEKVNLPSRVIRAQYKEWYSKKRGYERLLSLQSSSTTPVENNYYFMDVESGTTSTANLDSTDGV